MLVDNHTHIRHFAISTKFLGKEQSAKVDAGNGLPVSNLVTLAWKISQEEVDHRISTSRGRRRLAWLNSNASRQLQRTPFNRLVHRLKKLGKALKKLAGWVPRELTEHNSKAKRVWIFTDSLQRNEQGPFLKNLVIRDESWLLSSKTSKERS